MILGKLSKKASPMYVFQYATIFLSYLTGEDLLCIIKMKNFVLSWVRKNFFKKICKKM